MAGHFRLRSHQILMNYREYTDQSECMVKLLLKLVNAFDANGLYCKHHLSQVVTKVFGKLNNLADLLAEVSVF